MGDASVVIGTHALFQKDVTFHNLGLVIVDEQHRFGVHQRLALREKGSAGNRSPHQLVMTATPIPRTLSMSMYADMDVSVIDELPPGRTPVNTTVLSDEKRDAVVTRVADACSEGRQAYWVCTLIEESEVLQCQAAEVTAEELGTLLPDIRIGLVHGRMTPANKTGVMNEFKLGNIDLLVATTVIEVGVDVPNASLMIIENSERLGLAQLHQLRGRVGRGTAESHCVLMYKKPLGNLSRERLDVMRRSNDGFEIAERDLEIRGPGELLGARQSGALQFRIADLLRDQALLPEVRRVSLALMDEDRERAEVLVRRWIKDPARLYAS
jgi:ATP-dependent DNA helicase RecG